MLGFIGLSKSQRGGYNKLTGITLMLHYTGAWDNYFGGFNGVDQDSWKWLKSDEKSVWLFGGMVRYGL